MKLAKDDVIKVLREHAMQEEMWDLHRLSNEDLWEVWKFFGSFVRKILANGNSVNIPGVGIISRRLVNDRIGQNPKTGEKIKVPPFYTIKVKATEDFRHDS